MKRIKKTKMVKPIKLEDIPQHNADMRANAKPHVQSIMDEVQRAVDDENILMDQRLDGENKLRQWAKALCGIDLDMTEIEELNNVVRTLPCGGVYTLTPKRTINGQKNSIVIYKTAFGTVDRLDRYVFALEKTIVDITDNINKVSTDAVVQVVTKQYTDASFFDLIKLAFKRLLTRRK